MFDDAQIEHMVRRFLMWKLPANFQPDAGINFKPEFNVEWNEKQGLPPQRHEPVGTNLFDYTQAEAMVRHMVEGLPRITSSQATPASGELVEVLEICPERIMEVWDSLATLPPCELSWEQAGELAAALSHPPAPATPALALCAAALRARSKQP